MARQLIGCTSYNSKQADTYKTVSTETGSAVLNSNSARFRAVTMTANARAEALLLTLFDERSHAPGCFVFVLRQRLFYDRNLLRHRERSGQHGKNETNRS